VKGRPADHPVIVHLDGPEQLEGWAAEVPPVAREIAERWWPGPLTLVLRRAPGVPDAVTGGRETVGLRVPDAAPALALLRAFGDGIAAPSANRFGAVSPTTAEHVRAGLGDEVDVVLDGGPCAVGVESTILDLSVPARPRILRAGGVSAEDLAGTLGALPETDRGPARAPGMLAAHYAPRARVLLAGDAREAGRLVAALGDPGATGVLLPAQAGEPPPGAVLLARPAGAAAYARVLYAALREADERGLTAVVAVPPPAEGIGRAVADRLRRAAAAG
jgi:L-threonylcarbamoyladenylate synthase